MQFPESWLRTMVNPPVSTQALAHQLTMAGLEVEETEPVAPFFSGVVAARIESVEPHPNADKLRVCRVNTGGDTLLQIVCGAPNAAAGMTVPLAQVGAVLPGDIKIALAKMRGVESAGMLCSARELGLSKDHAGLMDLGDGLAPGTPLREALQLDDTLFTLKLTPNRADCLSILGIAREVGALTQTTVNDPPVDPVPVVIPDRVTVNIQAPDLCARFTGRVVRGVNARVPTPGWMVQRLERAGQRSVSVLVDISNYLMIERGRPTHVFDLDKLAKPELTVRWGQPGETLKLLNGETIEINPGLGVIASEGKPESLAGIMGGHDTSVSLETRHVYLEAAFWWPESIAGRTRQLKLTSEAAHRFERGTDFATTAEDLERLTRLVIDICGGSAGPVDDIMLDLPPRPPVKMRLARCRKVLGIDLSVAEVGDVFKNLGLAWFVKEEVFEVTPPSYRFDIRIEEDLIEEVARMIGFDNIPSKPPLARAKMRVRPEAQRSPHTLRQRIAERDYQEVVNFSFVERDWEVKRLGHARPIELLNPIASGLAVMRSSLLPGLVANVVYNANRRLPRVRVFELGRVFVRADIGDSDLTVAGVDQPLRLAVAAWGDADSEQWGLKSRAVDFFDVKGDLEALLGKRQAEKTRFVPSPHPLFHPGRSARVVLEDRMIGWIGELHPQWTRADDLSSAPVLFEVDVSALSTQSLPRPTTLSRQPVVQRDMALWVNADIAVQSILDTITSTIKADPALSVVRHVSLFDVWSDPKEAVASQVSLAFRFWLQDQDVTLEDERVDRCMLAIRQALERAHHVRQR